jgi:hypothetical protein
MSISTLLAVLVLVAFSTQGLDIVLPSCQAATWRDRRSAVCTYLAGDAQNSIPLNNTECTDEALCDVLSRPVLEPRCKTPTQRLKTSIYDGIVNRSFYITYPGGCDKPEFGWPFLLFFSFVLDQNASTLSDMKPEIVYLRDQLLAQGVAFVMTTMYWKDTYDQRDCNNFELGTFNITSGTCPTCLSDSGCRPLDTWFTCGNSDTARDIVMMRNVFSNWHARNDTKDLDISRMAYLGWSVGGHMVSRMIQMSTE